MLYGKSVMNDRQHESIRLGQGALKVQVELSENSHVYLYIWSVYMCIFTLEIY